MKSNMRSIIPARKFLFRLVLPIGLVAVLTIACSAQPPAEVALGSLREMSARGSLPPESVAADVEARYPGTKTGALARLLRAHIRLQSGDAGGAAALLESDQFAKLTSLGDYALWLRGKALTEAGRENEAQDVFASLVRNYPESIRVRDAKLLWARSLLKNGGAAKVPALLEDLSAANDGEAVILAADAYDKAGDTDNAVRYLRKAYFYAAGTDSGKTAFARLKAMGQDPEPKTADEILARANDLFHASKFADAVSAFEKLVAEFPAEAVPEARLRLLTSYAKSGRPSDAAAAIRSIPVTSGARPEGHYRIALAYAVAKKWPEALAEIEVLRNSFPDSEWTPKSMIDAGMAARDQRRRKEESDLLSTAVIAYPEAIDVAKAQFELAWLQHESGNFEISSRMLTEHLARYVDKDNTYRGQTGYWAARDSERAGKIDEACALYDATVYRYGSNWYGYLALDRLSGLRSEGKCQRPAAFPAGSLVTKAVENLKVVTVAVESAGEVERPRLERSADLSAVGLFSWSTEELEAARKTAENSPSVNLALAQHYRLRGDNVNALLALAKSYPDYAQMFPEELTRDEWDIFYPLAHWGDIKFWASRRSLDPYHVAGLIRQETIFNPNARSSANAYGLMQLLIPTAQMMARKYSSNPRTITASSLYEPAFNIELGTAYMREQLDKYGRLEYMSVAYNAGPGRVVSWQKTLPQEMDEFVEQIPFKETRGYVKGVIRNSAQYRRLYDLDGRFKPNVGSKPLRAAVDSTPGRAAGSAPAFVTVLSRKTAVE